MHGVNRPNNDPTSGLESSATGSHPVAVSPVNIHTGSLRRVCAVCKQFMGGDPTSDKVSHGMHPACAAQDWPSPYGMRVVRVTLEPEYQIDAGPVRTVCGWDGEILIWTAKPASAFGQETLAIAMADDEVKRICPVFDWTVEMRGTYLLALTPRDWSSEVRHG